MFFLKKEEARPDKGLQSTYMNILLECEEMSEDKDKQFLLAIGLK
jgi:hypothetical protein